MSAAVLNCCMWHIVDVMANGGAHVFHVYLMFRLERSAVYGGWFEDPDGDDQAILEKPTLLFLVHAPEPDSNRWCLVYACDRVLRLRSESVDGPVLLVW